MQSPAWLRTFNLCGLGHASDMLVATLVGDHRMGRVGETARKPKRGPACTCTRPPRPLLPPPRVLSKSLHPEEPLPARGGPCPWSPHPRDHREAPAPSTPVPFPGPDRATPGPCPAALAGRSLLTAPQVPAEGDTHQPHASPEPPTWTHRAGGRHSPERPGCLAMGRETSVSGRT